MIEHRFTVIALVGAHMMLALAAGFYSWLVPVGDSLDDMPAGIVSISQMSLLALWLCFGRSYLLVRVLLILLAGYCLTVLSLCAEAGGWRTFSISGMDWFIVGILFAPIPCVLIPALVARKRGFEVFQHVERPSGDTRDSLQFTLVHLLLWIGAISLLLGLSRLLAAWSKSWSTVAVLIVCALLLGFVSGSVALASMWASLTDARPMRRIAIVTVLAAGGGMMAGYAVSGTRMFHPSTWLRLAVMLSIVAVIVNVSLVSLRQAGFRISARSRDATPASARESVW